MLKLLDPKTKHLDNTFCHRKGIYSESSIFFGSIYVARRLLPGSEMMATCVKAGNN